MTSTWLDDGGSSHGGFEERRESFGVGENKQATIVSVVEREREREQ